MVARQPRTSSTSNRATRPGRVVGALTTSPRATAPTPRRRPPCRRAQFARGRAGRGRTLLGVRPDGPPHGDSAWPGCAARRHRPLVRRRPPHAAPHRHHDPGGSTRRVARHAWTPRAGWPRHVVRAVGSRGWSRASSGAPVTRLASRRQLRATLGAPILHDSTPVLRPHALTESVLLLPTPVVRLVGALHGGVLFSQRGHAVGRVCRTRKGRSSASRSTGRSGCRDVATLTTHPVGGTAPRQRCMLTRPGKCTRRSSPRKPDLASRGRRRRGHLSTGRIRLGMSCGSWDSPSRFEPCGPNLGPGVARPTWTWLGFPVRVVLMFLSRTRRRGIPAIHGVYDGSVLPLPSIVPNWDPPLTTASHHCRPLTSPRCPQVWTTCGQNVGRVLAEGTGPAS